MYKTESTLGLIGSILALVALILTLLAVLLFSFVFHGDLLLKIDVFRPFMDTVRMLAGPIIIVVFAMLFVFLTGAIVLGFVGTSMLRKENKNGGILLIVAGGLLLVSLPASHIFGLAIITLFLVGGIMALSKKTAKPS